MSSNEAAHLPPNFFQGIFWHFTAQVNLSKFWFFIREHTVVFPNPYMFSLNLAVDLGVDLRGSGSFQKGTGRPQCNDESI